MADFLLVSFPARILLLDVLTRLWAESAAAGALLSALLGADNRGGRSLNRGAVAIWIFYSKKIYPEVFMNVYFNLSDSRS